MRVTCFDKWGLACSRDTYQLRVKRRSGKMVTFTSWSCFNKLLHNHRSPLCRFFSWNFLSLHPNCLHNNIGTIFSSWDFNVPAHTSPWRSCLLNCLWRFYSTWPWPNVGSYFQLQNFKTFLRAFWLKIGSVDRIPDASMRTWPFQGNLGSVISYGHMTSLCFRIWSLAIVRFL